MSREKIFESCVFFSNSDADISFIKREKKKNLINFTPLPNENSHLNNNIIHSEIYNDYDSFNHETQKEINKSNKNKMKSINSFFNKITQNGKIKKLNFY